MLSLNILKLFLHKTEQAPLIIYGDGNGATNQLLWQLLWDGRPRPSQSISYLSLCKLILRLRRFA